MVFGNLFKDKDKDKRRITKKSSITTLKRILPPPALKRDINIEKHKILVKRNNLDKENDRIEQKIANLKAFEEKLNNEQLSIDNRINDINSKEIDIDDRYENLSILESNFKMKVKIFCLKDI